MMASSTPRPRSPTRERHMEIRESETAACGRCRPPPSSARRPAPRTRPAAPGERAVVGQRLGESPWRSPRPAKPPGRPETRPGCCCVAKAAANTGASVETEPSISPARPGWTTCSTNSRRCGFFFLARVRRRVLFFQRLGQAGMLAARPPPDRRAACAWPRRVTCCERARRSAASPAPSSRPACGRRQFPAAAPATPACAGRSP